MHSDVTQTAEAERLRRLVDEQAAVRRVATIVTAGAPPAELFASILHEVVQLLGVTGGWLLRYEAERTVTVLAALRDPGVSTGDRWPVDDHGLAAMVLETGGPVRIDDVSGLAGAVATHARESGFRSTFCVPITVDGSVWGLMCV